MITPAHKRALNRALHELRRPLQALVLLEERSGQPAGGTARRQPPRAAGGGRERASRPRRGAQRRRAGQPPRERFNCREVVLACLERWRPAAAHGRRDSRLLGRRPGAGRGRCPADGAGVRQPDRQRARARRPAVGRDRRPRRRAYSGHHRKRPWTSANVANAAIRVGGTGPRSSRRSRAPTAAGLRSAGPAAAASQPSSFPWPSRVTRWRREPPGSRAGLPDRRPRLRGARGDRRRALSLPDRGPLRSAAAGRRRDGGAAGRPDRSASSGRGRRCRCGGSRRASSRPER